MPIRFLAAIAFAGATMLAQASDVRNATLDVKGMDCAACPITVKTVLKRQPGVSDVTEAGYPTTPRK
jgi:periplasmic mercuric ion binding protein